MWTENAGNLKLINPNFKEKCQPFLRPTGFNGLEFLMFVLAVLKDVVRHAPENFGKDRNISICDEINRKFANKVCFCI